MTAVIPNAPPPDGSRSHLVLIPSYNTGDRVLHTVREACREWDPVWVVVDGSTDGSAEKLERLALAEPGLRVIVLAHNRGKGGAILHGLEQADREGFTHVLAMDADGQHPAAKIREFMAVSAQRPEALVLGRPQFDASAPRVRVLGRRISNAWSQLETLSADIGDSLFGFRVYPVQPLLAIMSSNPWMRRFDFDVEAAVRLVWAGVPTVNMDAPVRYLSAEQGGVSHFRYLRDNLLLSWMHIRLVLGFSWRLPLLVWRRMK